MLNPQSLAELIKLKTLKKSSKLAATILGKLGGSIFILPEGGEIEPMKSSSTDENTEDSDVKPEPRIDLSMLPEPPVTEVVRTPNINPNLFAQAPTGIMQNLTNTERALLSPEEQVIRQRTRT